MKALYFDCFNGAAGDMLAGALIDSGIPLDEITDGLRKLNVPGYSLSAEKVRKQGFAATKFDVIVDDSQDKPHRHLSDIEAILNASSLPESVREKSLAVFERLANAEATAHGIDRDKVHFHEVGAIDAIVDIVAVSLAIEWIAPDRIACSHLPVGSGTVKCEHGIMPVPAPATAILLKGVPLAQTEETGELLTPTAAAILTTFCDSFGPLPSMSIDRIGLGAGTRDGKTRPNVLRVLVGSTVEDALCDTVAVLEANIDDAPGEWIGHCISRLLDAGALDAYTVPIYMKKNRPGVMLSVICTPELRELLEGIVFEETPTFGIRHHLMQRSKLDRKVVTVETEYGEIRIKVGSKNEGTQSAAPEYEDCSAAALKHGVALRTVMAAAMQRFGSQE